MARTIKLLPGSRGVGNDISIKAHGWFYLRLESGETDKVVVDCERWLDGATVSSAAEVSGFISASLSSPLITLTITGSDAAQEGDIIITASDGRIRKVKFETTVIDVQSSALDYRDAI